MAHRYLESRRLVPRLSSFAIVYYFRMLSFFFSSMSLVSLRLLSRKSLTTGLASGDPVRFQSLVPFFQITVHSFFVTFPSSPSKPISTNQKHNHSLVHRLGLICFTLETLHTSLDQLRDLEYRHSTSNSSAT